MPKLKKLSQLETEKLQAQPPNQSNLQFQEETNFQSNQSKASEDDSLSDKKSLKLKGKRERKNKSKKTLKEENLKKANQALKAMIQQYADGQDSNTHQFIPEDEFNQPKKRKSKKSQGKEIKVRNKYFKDITMDDRPSYQTDLPEAQLELEVKKKPESRQKQFGKIKSRFENKVNNIKNKLQNKKYSEDPRFKEQLKKAITKVENVNQENLNIVVDMPKVFSGPNMNQANALFLIKDTKQASQPTQQIESRKQTFQNTQQKKKTKQHRRSFFKDLDKQIKMKKVISVENKDYFRKSSLDDFDGELNKNEHLLRDNSLNYKEKAYNEQSNSLSKKSNISVPRLSTKNSQLPSPVIEEISNSNAVKKINKANKSKIKRTQGNFLMKLTKQYKEEEAEDSDISGYHVEGEQSDEDDDADIESLIDYDNVDYVEKDELNVRKLINQREKQEHERLMKVVREKYSNITKTKIEDNSSSRKRIQRIKQAKKRYEEEDSQGIDFELIQFISGKKENFPTETQEHQKQDFMNKLKDLERETGVDRKKQTENQDRKVKNKKSIWEHIKVNQRVGGEKKRGGFEKEKRVAGSRVNTPKRRSKDSKEISFDKDN